MTDMKMMMIMINSFNSILIFHGRSQKFEIYRIFSGLTKYLHRLPDLPSHLWLSNFVILYFIILQFSPRS